MATTVVVNAKLVTEAMRLSGAKSPRVVAEVALRELVARRKSRHALLNLTEELIAPDYDVRAARRRMPRPRTPVGK